MERSALKVSSKVAEEETRRRRMEELRLLLKSAADNIVEVPTQAWRDATTGAIIRLPEVAT